MKKTFLFTLLIFVTFFVSANNIIVRSSSSTALEIAVEIPDTEFSERNFADGNKYSSILKPVGASKVPGNPNVPGFASWILIPNGTDANISVNPGEPTIFEDVNLAPVQPALPELKNIKPSPFIKNQSIYSANSQYPGLFAETEGIKQKRGQDCTILWVYPYQYNPVEKTLYLYSDLSVSIHFSGTAEPISANLITDAHLNALRSMAINGTEIVNYESEISQTNRDYREDGAELLIVTHPNFLEAAQTLANWKKKKGIQTEIISTDIIGDTAAQIESYVDDAYFNWNPAPSYLLLMGDSEYVPTHYVNQHPYSNGNQGYTGSDLFYADTAYLPDYIADMGFGRIPVDTSTEADSVIARIIRYERNPPTDASYYTNTVMAGAFQDGSSGSPPNTIADRRFCKTSEDARNFLNNAGYNADRIYKTYNGYSGSQIDPMYWNDLAWAVFENDVAGQEIPIELQRPNYPWNGSGNDVSNSMNAGKFMLLHRDHGGRNGWGEPDFDSWDVDNLNNGEKRPIVWSINCNTGWYDNETDDYTCGTDNGSECFTEHWINHSSGGSIGLIASTRVSYSGYNDRLVWGWMDAVWPYFTTGYNDPYGNDNPIYKMSDVVNYGKEYMMTKVDDDEIRRTALEEFHWFGDPTMEMWTAAPSDITANYPQTINVGSTQIQIDCAEENAVVCLFKDGEILGTAQTLMGSVIINFPVLTDLGTISLTITKHNFLIFEEEITIVSEDTFIICDEATFTETGFYNDGSLQSLDTLNVNISLTNIGFEDTVESVIVVLSSQSDYVSILQNTVESEIIPTSETVVLDNAFQIELLPGIEDNAILQFELNITSGTDSWQSEFELAANAPVIEFLGYSLEFNDVSDDILEPGESVAVQLNYRNIGGGISYDFSTNLYTFAEGIEIDGNDVISQILPGESKSTEQLITVSISEDFDVESSAEIQFMGLDLTGSLLTGSFDLHIGYILYDFEVGTVNWNHFPLSDESIDQWHLSDARNFTESGSFSMKCGDSENGTYANSMFAALETPTTEIGEGCYIKVRHWLQTTTYNDTLCWDGGIVEISVDDAEFEQIMPVNEYPCTMINNPNAPFEFQTPMFAGEVDWEEIEFDLSDVSGSVKLRFVFGSVTFATLEGWYIDDLKVGKYPETDANEQDVNYASTRLIGNYPNPFNPSTKISFELSAENTQNAEIIIYNIKGQEIRQYSNINNQSSITWAGKDKNGNSVSSGIYFYKLKTDDFSAVKKMLMIK